MVCERSYSTHPPIIARAERRGVTLHQSAFYAELQRRLECHAILLLRDAPGESLEVALIYEGHWRSNYFHEGDQLVVLGAVRDNVLLLRDELTKAQRQGAVDIAAHEGWRVALPEDSGGA